MLEKLRDLCARHWNPIGVPMANITTEAELGFPPLPADEYDTYLRYVGILLEQRAPDDAIHAYLERVEVEFLGMMPRPGRKEAFIRALRQEFSERS